MEFIVISFFTAVGKLIILCKVFGAGKCVRMQVILDAIFTIAVPMLLIGTFSGAVVAVLSGIWFTCLLWFLSLFVKPVPLFNLRKNKVIKSN